jgi:threonine dehydrogenase-like Zn-dependent dehydrogenase
MIRKYDVAVIGAGLAGLFACYNILKNKPKTKIALVDIGKQFLKRRSQMIGALGILPNSDGKLYISDIAKVEKLTNNKDLVHKNAFNSLDVINSIIGITPKYVPRFNDLFLNNIKDYELTYNDHYQLYPRRCSQVN